MTSIMINVDLIPTALKNPTDPRTESTTSMTPDKPSRTYKSSNPKINSTSETFINAMYATWT